MIRTVLTPDNQNILVNLPKYFVGKRVEVSAFIIEELSEKNVAEPSTLTHFASEKVLAKDWLSIEEDLAWKDL